MKKITSILILVVLMASPLHVFAQTTTNNLNTTQAAGARNGATSTSSGSADSAAGGLGSCAVGSMLSNVVQSQVSGLISSVTEQTEVPTNPVDITNKETGGVLGVSWDAIGFCLINSIIEYIGTATVQWINSGFQGNPVFVENPEQFFADVADIEAGNFLGEISSGYLCGPIQSPVRINLANSYNNRISPYSQRGQCTFSGISGNLDQFISGQSGNWQDFISYQRPQNNTYGATVSAQLELDKRIAQAINTESQLLAWGRGFLSFKDPETGEISSPGSVIEQQLNDRLGSGQRRLEIADEFDEIVNALVNSLIKIAISEVTTSLND
jgi:hypothetical protein